MATLSETHIKLYRDIVSKLQPNDAVSNTMMTLEQQISNVFGRFEHYINTNFNNKYLLFVIKHYTIRNINTILREYFPKDMANVIQSYCYNPIYLVHIENRNRYSYYNKYTPIEILILLNETKIYRNAEQLKEFLFGKLDSGAIDNNLANILN